MKIIDEKLAKIWKEGLEPSTPQEQIAATKEDIDFTYKNKGSDDQLVKRRTGCA